MIASQRLAEINVEIKKELSKKGVPNFVLNSMDFEEAAMVRYLDEQSEDK